MKNLCKLFIKPFSSNCWDSDFLSNCWHFIEKVSENWNDNLDVYNFMVIMEEIFMTFHLCIEIAPPLLKFSGKLLYLPLKLAEFYYFS